MAISGLSGVSSYINTIFNDAVFVAREMSLMAGLVTNLSAEGYATRIQPIWSAGTAQTVADGVDYTTGATLTKSQKASFTPSQVIAQFLLTDQMVSTDPDGAVAAATLELGSAAAEKVDLDLLGTFASFTTSMGTAGSALTLGNVASAMAVVRNNKARGEVSCVLHPYQWHDIWVALNQPAANQAFLGDTANQAMRDYYVGRAVNITWYTSSNITVDSSDDATGAVFVREAIALDVREGFTLRPQRDESLRADELNFVGGYAYGLLWGERGVRVISDATQPT